MSDLEIRLATQGEYHAVGELTVAAYEADAPVGSYADVLRDAAARAVVGELLVAVDGDDVVGTATLIPPEAPAEWREKTPAGGATLRMVAVAAGARGRGIATALTEACIDRARDRGWPQLCLLTVERMRTARRIYDAARVRARSIARLADRLRPVDGLLARPHPLTKRARSTTARTTTPRATTCSPSTASTSKVRRRPSTLVRVARAVTAAPICDALR